MSERAKRTVEIWDRCECGKTLHSIAEGVRGLCSTCWFKDMPADTRASLKKLIAAAFKPTTEAEKHQVIDDAMSKVGRDEAARKA